MSQIKPLKGLSSCSEVGLSHLLEGSQWVVPVGQVLKIPAHTQEIQAEGKGVSGDRPLGNLLARVYTIEMFQIIQGQILPTKIGLLQTGTVLVQAALHLQNPLFQVGTASIEIQFRDNLLEHLSIESPAILVLVIISNNYLRGMLQIVRIEAIL